MRASRLMYQHAKHAKWSTRSAQPFYVRAMSTVCQFVFRWESLAASGIVVALLAIAGCQQKMADQPSYKPLEPCDFFEDGRSERPTVPGTVARGALRTDVALFTGRTVEAAPSSSSATLRADNPPPSTAPTIASGRWHAGKSARSHSWFRERSRFCAGIPDSGQRIGHRARPRPLHDLLR